MAVSPEASAIASTGKFTDCLKVSVGGSWDYGNQQAPGLGSHALPELRVKLGTGDQRVLRRMYVIWEVLERKGTKCSLLKGNHHSGVKARSERSWKSWPEENTRHYSRGFPKFRGASSCKSKGRPALEGLLKRVPQLSKAALGVPFLLPLPRGVYHGQSLPLSASLCLQLGCR